MRFTAVSAALSVIALGACDSGTTVTDGTPSYATQAAAYNAMLDDVRAMPVTTSATMRNTGGATYDGYATVLVDTPTQTAVVGDAVLTADFADGSLTGNLSNFVGSVNGAGEEDFAGAIGLKDGVIGATTASSLTADMKGTLTGNDTGNTVTVIGGVQGEFHDDGGVNAAGLAALETADTDFIVNGTGRDGDVGIVALR